MTQIQVDELLIDIYVVYDYNGRHHMKNSQQCDRYHNFDEVAIILSPNAVVEECAVVVEAGRAPIARSAMLRRVHDMRFADAAIEIVEAFVELKVVLLTQLQ